MNIFSWHSMRRVFVMVWLWWSSIFLHAQSQQSIYYFRSDIVAIKTLYNAKNEVIGRLEYTALDVKYDRGKSIARGKTVKIKDNKETETIIGRFTYDGTQLLISMGKTAKGQEAWLDYAPDMALVQGIISYLEFETEAKFIGQTMKMCCKISDRRALSVGERITTSLGSWNCVKTGYNMSIKSKSLGITIPVDVYIEEWFADGFGIVRTDVYKNGKLHECRLLTGFRSNN